MGRFSVIALEVATGAVVGTYKSILGLKAANTVGHRGKVRRLSVGFGGEAAQDVNVSLRLTKTDNNSDGTSTAVTAKRKDESGMVVSVMTGGKNYTVEPDNVDSQHLWECGLNSRGSLVIDWGEDGPVWGENETLLLQATPGAAAAVKMTATLEWDEGN